MIRLSIVAAVAVILCAPNISNGQNRRPTRYRPSRPTISPYMDYFRRDSGILPRYQTFIEPGRRRRATARSVQGELGQLRGRNEAQGAELEQLRQMQANQRFRPGGAPVQRTAAASYQNFSHFYPRKSRAR